MPILKRDLKIRIRIAKIFPAIILRYACLGFIFLLVVLSRLGTGLLAFVIAEAVLILLFTPGIICDVFISDIGRRDLHDLALTRLNSRDIILGKLAGANFYNFIVIVFSAIVMFIMAISGRKLNTGGIIYANIALLILMFTSSVIGLVSSVLFPRNIFTAVMLAYVIIFLLIGSIIIPGPVIDRIQNPGIRDTIVKIAIYANPIIMVSRSLGKIDIMRTEYMYVIADPIVGRGFAYPDWRFMGIMYLGISCLLMIPIFIRFKNR